MVTFWTSERVDALRACVDGGMTSAQAARFLKTTRNTVIGKAAREGLEWANSSRRKFTPTEIRTRQQRRMAIRRERSKPFVCVPTTEPEPQGDVPTGCRWLHGEANERNFCGSPTDTSWCPFHRAIVFSRATVNEREAA